MERYSAWTLAWRGLTGRDDWPQAWRSPEPKPAYDVVIVGGGGHGLAAAYYLAKRHGVRSVAVLERGWIGGGNTGRNTTIVRSDYYYPESAKLFDLSLDLYSGLGRELNFNVMVSHRGHLTLAHSREELDFQRRLVNAMRLNGLPIRAVDRAEALRLCPLLADRPGARFPIHGGFWEGRAGTVRHDAVVWGYARAADAEGVDIIQNVEVTGFRRDATGAATGVETSRGPIAAKRVGLAAAGHTTALAERAGFRLPLRCFALQAFVTEPLKPALDIVVSSNAVGGYVSQSDRGGLVFGAGIDRFASFAQRGSPATAEATIAGLLEIFPSFSRVRLLRQWAGVVDYTYDSSPILGQSPVANVFLNCGWGGGGFKAIPAGGVVFAHTLATGEPHPLAAPFGLARFREGALIDEAAGAGIEH